MKFMDITYKTKPFTNLLYPVTMSETIEDAGYSYTSTGIHAGKLGADLTFGGMDDIYGSIFFDDYEKCNALILNIVVKNPIPKTQFNAVTELLLQLPMFTEKVFSLDNVRKGF